MSQPLSSPSGPDQGRATVHYSDALAGVRLFPGLTEKRGESQGSVFRIFQRRRSAALLLELSLDFVLAMMAMVLAAMLIEDHTWARAAEVFGQGKVWLTAFSFAAALTIWQYMLRVYHGPVLPVVQQFGRWLAAVAIAGYLAYLSAKAQQLDSHTSRMVGWAVLVLLGAMWMVRGSVLLRRALRGRANVLIVGTAEEAQAVVADLDKLDEARPRSVVGYYPTGPGALDDQRVDVRKLTRQESLLAHVRAHRVNEVIVAAREQRGGVVPMDQLLVCRCLGIPVMDAAGFYERTHGEVPLESLKASWLIYGGGFVQGRLRRSLKRVFDLLVSGMLLLLTSPVMLLAALLIKLESRGPIIYKQERVGLDGKPFTCLKFRSMVVDAERDGVAKWASKNDSRITRVGKFIRQTRIDELPQLISVLRGEMSMVGPRPERPSFVTMLSEKVPFYDLRHTVKPGVTGWAQVRYAYGASLEDSKRKHQFDLYYVKNNSLLLDILILLETVGVVLQREGQ